jgi:hypothetical protein
MAERRLNDGPYMWATKSVLNRILNNAQGEANNAQGLHIYWSLCWIASNEQSNSFDCKVTHIAQLAGYRYRTAHAALGDLEKLGVIQIERTKGSARGPSRYTLIGFKADKKKGQGKEGKEKGSAENVAQPRRKF